MRNQSVRSIPRFEVAAGPCGKADTTFNHRPSARAMSRTSSATSARSCSWLRRILRALDESCPERTVDAGNETDIRGVVVFVGNTV